VSMIHHQSTRSLSFLQAEWILILADCTSAVSSDRPQPGALEVSSSDLVVEATHYWPDDDLPGNCPCHMTKQTELSRLN